MVRNFIEIFEKPILMQIVNFSLSLLLFLSFASCQLKRVHTITNGTDSSTLSRVNSDTNYNEILYEPEKYAHFPGGEEALFSFLDKNLNTSIVSDSTLKQGRVWAYFTIDTIGKIYDIQINKSYNKSVDNEFIRVIKLMPNWIPGELLTNNNIWIKVRNNYNLPLKIPYKPSK